MEGGPPSATTRQKSPVLIGLNNHIQYHSQESIQKELTKTMVSIRLLLVSDVDQII